ncbi:MAG TPA: hypothetical protein ENG48_12445 [Candidatus Atribacteria bacterium]|nr:hypothetical protein [Candidatus Atribacteria bacterium]
MAIKVNLKKARRLTKKMELRGISPPKKTTISMDKRYTNLIKNLSVNRPNGVWCADIAYVKALSMEVSNSSEKEMCLDATREAIKKYGIPEIIHTDKGRQFMSSLYRYFGGHTNMNASI